MARATLARIRDRGGTGFWHETYFRGGQIESDRPGQVRPGHARPWLAVFSPPPGHAGRKRTAAGHPGRRAASAVRTRRADRLRARAARTDITGNGPPGLMDRAVADRKEDPGQLNARSAVRAGLRIWFNRQVTVQIGHSVVSGEQVHILKAHWAPPLARVPPDRAGQSWFSAVRIPVRACWPSRPKAGLSSGARRRDGPLKVNSAV